MSDKIDEYVDVFKELIGETNKLTDAELSRIVNEMMTRVSVMPDNHFLSKAYLRKCEYHARDDESNYKCFICDKTYDDSLEMLKHIEEHLIDFYAGVPFTISKDLYQRLSDMLPDEFSKHLDNFITPEE